MHFQIQVLICPCTLIKEPGARKTPLGYFTLTGTSALFYSSTSPKSKWHRTNAWQFGVHCLLFLKYHLAQQS